ncbi:MAG: endolytic transglycosylase MltG [Luteimonas sp.]
MSPARKRQRRPGFGFVITALLVGFLAYWVVTHYVGFADTPIAGLQAGATVSVEPGDSFTTVLAKLRVEGVRQGHALEWQALGRELGAAGKLQVGEYALQPGTTPRALLQHMRDGKVIGHRFTIVEGWNIRDLRAALQRAPLLRHDAAALDDAALMKALGHPGQHPEGRFLPETYQFTRGDSELSVLGRAYAAMSKALDEAWRSRVPDTGLQVPEQMLTLASIVEKETANPDERPQIAGLFERRLKIGMRLETDPTIIYGMGASYNGDIRLHDKLADTPYNTYVHAGLPPTPIAMPGVASLRAVAHPAPGDALFFVAIGDGSGRHLFARTYAEHQRNVASYLRNYHRAQATTTPATRPQ